MSKQFTGNVRDAWTKLGHENELTHSNMHDCAALCDHLLRMDIMREHERLGRMHRQKELTG